MNKFLFNKTRLHQLIFSVLFLLLGINASWGQAQTLGSFPYMDGGFEGQTATIAGSTISGTLSTSAWSVSSTTNSSTRLMILDANAARSGNKYASHTTTSTTGRLQSPTTATAANAPAAGTSYTVQYYYKTTTDQTTAGATQSLQGSIYNDNSLSYSKSTTVTSNYQYGVWTKAYCTLTTNSGAPGANQNFAAVRHLLTTSSNVNIDDFVVYAGSLDTGAPSAASSPTAAIASATTFNIGWTASADADKTGYMVVRYTANPSSNALAVPNVNGIYAVGNTISNGGLTGTVAYIGNGTSFTDTVANTSVQTYYRIYTVDKAFNYSTPLDLTTVIDTTPPGNPGVASVAGATASSLAVSWQAASSIDGGGYLVVRYTSNPNANNDPTQQQAYVVGNTYTNGTGSLTGTVIYVGTGLTVTDTALSELTTYYYKVYTFDQAYNYSGESTANGTTTSATVVDNTPPNNPGAVTISNQTTSSMTTSWVAAVGGVDGGGYMVLRFTGTPDADANPVQKTTYAAGDSILNLGSTTPKTAKVVYVGTDLSCSNTLLTEANNYYFRVYTFDQDHNYSGASSVTGRTSAQLATPIAVAGSTTTDTGFTANWNSVVLATGYNVAVYNSTNALSTIVGWTIPAALADTTSLTADITTTNNTSKALTQNSLGTITTTVSGNPSTGFAARGSTYYSTNLVSGTEALNPVYATPKATPDKYWQIEVNTLGYKNATISSDQYSTATGPRDWKLQYSSTGPNGTFTDLVSTITLGSAVWNTSVSNVALPASCQNNPSVVLRWVQTSFTNTNGVEMTVPSTGGTSRIDNILVKGEKLNLVTTLSAVGNATSSIAITGLVGGTYYYDVVATGTSTTSTSGVVSTYANSANSNVISYYVPVAQSYADFKSVGDVSLSSAANWQYNNGTEWLAATAAPTSANNITVSSGNSLVLGTNFSVNSGKTMTINGTIDLAGYVVSGAGSFAIATTGTVSATSTTSYATIKLGNNTSLATAITTTSKSFGTAVNYFYNGNTVQYLTSLPAIITGNITISNSSTDGVYLVQHTAINAPGAVAVAAGTKLWFGDGQTTDTAVAGRGTFNLTGSGSFTAGNGSTLVVTGSKGLSLGTGNMSMTGTRTWGTGINFWFYKNDGFTVMQMGDLFVSEITSINNLVVNNPFGVYLPSGAVTSTNTINSMITDFAPLTNITINGDLTFISGKLIANNGSAKLTSPGVATPWYPVVGGVTSTTPRATSVPSNVGTATVIVAGSIIGAGNGTTTFPNGFSDGKWVVGNLKKLTTSGNSPSFTFTIGDATTYYPLALTFSGNTSADGGLTARTYSGFLSNTSDAGIDNTNKVNRYWSLTNSNLAGFGTYQATFNYASTDNDAGTTPSNYVVRRYDNSSWSTVTVSGTPTTTTTTATGITGFGNFAIGQSNDAAPVAADQSFCGSATVADLIPSSGTSFKWYAEATGGTALDSSTALSTGTYYVALSFAGISETSRTPVAVTVNANSNASVINVNSIAALQTAINESNCGDVIVLADGHYTNATLNIDRSNITVKAATNGGVYLDGTNDININGNYVKFSGFQFTSGDIGGNYLIEVWGSHNTLSQLNFNGYAAKKFIVIQANSQYNTVEYSNIKKLSDTDITQLGCAVQIHTSYTTPGYHKIRYCSFQNFEGAGGDYGNEPIRIGLSTENANKSRSIVEYCYFNNTGLGDSETVSIKSQENTIRFCTFTNQQNAHLTFRNGDNNVAYSNFFINAGGIRVKEANNIYCYNNYFQNSGTTDTAISNRANAVTYLYDTSSYPVVLNNVNFVHNTFYNCANIDFGGIGATNNTWANNIFKKDSGSIFMNANGGTTFAGNMYQGTLGITIPSGMSNTNPNLTLNSDNYYGLTTGSPAIDASSSSYPAILHIPNIDDDASLLYDISGQSRVGLKDVGCDEFTSGTTTNHPLVLTEVGPTYLGGPTAAAPTALAQSFCNSATVANLVATGTAIKWYSSDSSPIALSSSTALSSGTYYATQTINFIESSRIAVAVTINVTSSPAAEAQTFCNSGTVTGLVASGTAIKWYSVASGGSALASSESLANGNYYATQTENGCESARTEVTVVIVNSVAPTASSQVFCSSANATVANLVASGTDLKWYSAATGGSALASDVALTSGNYYVSQTLNSCESVSRTQVAVSFTNGIAVQPVDTNICTTATTSLASISVVSYGGTPTYTWQYATAAAPTNWVTITAANAGTIYTTYTSATLNIKKAVTLLTGTKYRVTLTNGYCGSTVTSNEVTLTVNPITVSKAITASPATVCTGSGATLSLATASVGSIQWQKSTTSATEGFENVGTVIAPTSATNAVVTLSTGALTQDTWYRVVFSSGACSTATSAAVKVTVSSASTAGELTTAATTVCTANGTNLTLGTSIGTVAWYKSTNYVNTTGAAATWTLIPLSATVTSTALATGNLTYAAATPTTWYRAIATSGACTSPSNVVSVTVSPAAVVKAITASPATVCTGSGATLTLAAASVGSIQWQKSTTSATEGFENVGTVIAPTTATNAVTTLSTGALTQDTWYRIVFTNGACSVNTTAVKVTVSSAATAGELTTAATTVCTANGTNLTLGTSIGTVAWYKSTNYVNTTGAAATWTLIPLSATVTSTALATGNLTYAAATPTTWYRAIATSGACTSPSNVVSVTVSPAAKATAITGFNTATTQVCVGTTRTLSLTTGYVGTIEWLSSTALAGTYTVIPGATGSTYDYTPASTAPMYFKVRLTSSPCSATATSAAGVAVYAKACTVTSKVATAFGVKAYPNPYDSNFQLDFTTTSESQIQIRVYDMIGKLIETRQFSTSEMNNQELGSSYPSGVYNVIVTQGEEMKTLRVIKR